MKIDRVVRRMGNSYGVYLPKKVFTDLVLGDVIEVTVKRKESLQVPLQKESLQGKIDQSLQKDDSL